MCNLKGVHIPTQHPFSASDRCKRAIPCGHPESLESSVMIFVTPDNADDWAHLQSALGFDDGTPAVRICDSCIETLPSTINKKREAALRAERDEIEQAEEFTNILQRIKDGETFYFCESCETFHEEEEIVEVRYCSHCEITFNGTDNGRNCEECNRPFTRNCTEAGCPDCLDEDEECRIVDIVTLSAFIATQKHEE